LNNFEIVSLAEPRELSSIFTNRMFCYAIALAIDKGKTN